MDPEDAPCMCCAEVVNEYSQALQCDICNGWCHIGCAGVSATAYKTHQKMVGFQWLCKKCLVDLRTSRDENAALREQISELQSFCTSLGHTVKELQLQLKEVQSMHDCSKPLDTMVPAISLVNGGSLPIPVHSNPFETLSLSMDRDSREDILPKASPVDPPVLISASKAQHKVPNTTPTVLLNSSIQPTIVPSSDKPSEHIPTTSGINLFTLYIRNVPRNISVQEAEQVLEQEGLDSTQISLSQLVPDSDFTGKRKFFKASLPTSEACRKLVVASKLQKWTVKTSPPTKPRSHKPIQNWVSLQCPLPINHPFLGIPTPPHPPPPLNLRPIPKLMSLKLPPLPNHLKLPPLKQNPRVHNPNLPSIPPNFLYP